MKTGKMSLDELSKIKTEVEQHVDKIRQVSLTFGLSFYTAESFSTFVPNLLQCEKLFHDFCPISTMKYYRTETMSQHKPVTKRTFGMVGAWFKPDTPLRDLIGLEIKDGDEYRSAPYCKLRLLGEELERAQTSQWSNLISMAFPAEWGLTRTQELFELINTLARLIPFRSGHAGFSMECSPYAQESSQTHAWAKSMRYPGIDISLGGRKETIAAGRHAVRGVNWLTLLCAPFVDGLGGMEKIKNKLKDGCAFSAINGGVLIQAGEAPATGDTNRKDHLPAYQSVYQAVKPLVEIAIKNSPWISTGSGEEAKTERWYRRFENGQ